MSLTILQPSSSSFQSKNIVLVNLQYPYGKKQVYMNSSLVAVAAQLRAAGHSIRLLDLNLHSSEYQEDLIDRWADMIGVSVTSSPYIPPAIKFARKYGGKKPILIGGQAAAKLSTAEFGKLFGTTPIQITSDRDLGEVVGFNPSNHTMPSAFESPFHVALEEMVDTDTLQSFLSHEFGLVISQGCAYSCAFCGAEKSQRERFVDLDIFRNDVLWLADQAKRFGFKILQAYASSLDFFQNPETIVQYLRVLDDVQHETGIQLRLRCLSCTKSFLRAYRKITGFEQLLKDAGLWCMGFGVDGTDESVWRAQHKTQNDLNEVTLSLDICQVMGLQSEVLMVMGFPQDTARSLWKNVVNSVRYARRWKNVMHRPYLAKPFIPGNDGWKTEAGARKVVENPSLFYNLDFCALGSTFTHPKRWHRWLCNLSYLAIIGLFLPFGRCCTYPLLPQGEKGWYGKIARFVNRYMPFDR